LRYIICHANTERERERERELLVYGALKLLIANSVWGLKLLSALLWSREELAPATCVWGLKLLSALLWCREELAPGAWTFTARDYLDVFKDKGISCVVRSLLA
jgi:hypothetical protein